MSVDKATFGTTCLARCTRLSYASLLYPRFIRCNTLVLPDCAGMCR